MQRFQKLTMVGKVGAWMGFWLILIDLGINLLFPFPNNINQTPSSLQRYFDYGRSIEGKLNRMVKTEANKSDSLLVAGWIDPQSWRDQPEAIKGDDDLLVAVYGMSFANQAGEALAADDGKITLRQIAGPSAPPNHSFAAYQADQGGRNADVVMLGILASSVKRMRSLSGMNWTYENPSPYTYPYYQVDQAGELVAVEPAIATAEEFMTSFQRQDQRWQQLKAQMEQYDYPFDRFVFEENLMDHSALIRLIRRGWANRMRNQGEMGLYDSRRGFNPDAPEIQALQVMLTAFVTTAKTADQVPIVLLINDQGYDAHLYEVLAKHLEDLDVGLVSTHTIVPSNDPRNFISDGHFTPEANQKIGAALQKLIRSKVGS
ncbi:hypothetical protein VB712_19125 [Spirulina sp. CCNP1310]|uniref:hypothetical protein n=1 Tax=Spirulina sp. CCNP1310 TaxID=3110249 RepID=UPI002B206465|nr:hypothetical protein [Spirulina sp. CCNP1310]MEA5421342.1 hypothetical protein [Spirulina sp. CCNP1310]